MKMDEYGNQRFGTAWECQFWPNYKRTENWKVIFLTETKCKIRFIDVWFNYKIKKYGKTWLEKSAIRGGGGGVWRLIANVMKHFHFSLIPSIRRYSRLRCDPLCTMGVLSLARRNLERWDWPAVWQAKTLPLYSESAYRVLVSQVGTALAHQNVGGRTVQRSAQTAFIKNWAILFWIS